MRSLVLLVLFFAGGRLNAQARVSVAQLEEFLSAHHEKDSDAEIADRLGSVQLAEQLSDVRLARLSSTLRLGARAEEQLDLLAVASSFEAPPPSELPSDPPADAAAQQQMLDLARAFVATSVHHLPDFIATRRTESFNSTPQGADKSSSKPHIELHFIGEHRRQVTFRSGHEVSTASNAEEIQTNLDNLTTWGEFGPILATVLGDSSQDAIVWSRWQNDANGRKLAVFHYTVPKSASHDLIDLCCYLGFRDTPGYHGDLYLDPATGSILEITLEAELPNDAPVRVSKMAVRYGPVDISGKTYICPLRGVAVGVIHDAQLEKVDGLGLERFINVVHFTDYHKFGSTARVLTSQ